MGLKSTTVLILHNKVLGRFRLTELPYIYMYNGISPESRGFQPCPKGDIASMSAVFVL